MTATKTKKTATSSVKAPAAPKKPKIVMTDKPMTKSELFKTLSEQTGLKKKDIANLMDSLVEIIGLHIDKKGPSVFNFPGLFKIEVVKKAATKARKGVNPFTGEEMVFKAKPASRRVKVRVLKQLKELAN